MRLSMSIVGSAEAEACAKVICEDGYLGMGSATRKFEQEIAEYLNVSPWQVISVNSGTASLHLAVQTVSLSVASPTAGIPEIIAPTLTFVASFQAISAAGCRPVACDVRLDTGTLDLESAAMSLTENTIGIMHVDYASNPWRLEKVYTFAEKNGLRVIDDAAHAFGCRHHGRKIGSFGDLVCFSFDGIKNITCGEGGALIAFDRDSAKLAADARLLGVEGDTQKRFHGTRTWEPDVKMQGYRYHLSNIMAAIGSVQLKRLEKEFIPARRALYDIYKSLLEDLEKIRLMRTDPDDYIVPHIMPVRILDGLRPKVAARLDEAGIPYGMHYKPNHLLTFFGNGSSKLPNAEKLYSELITLPLHPGLSVQEVETICGIIKKALDE